MCNQFSLWRKDVYQLIPSKGNKGTPILTFLKAFKAQATLYTAVSACQPQSLPKHPEKQKQKTKVLESGVPAEKAGELSPLGSRPVRLIYKQKKILK